VPGTVPGAVPGSVPGTVPGPTPGARESLRFRAPCDGFGTRRRARHRYRLRRGYRSRYRSHVPPLVIRAGFVTRSTDA